MAIVNTVERPDFQRRLKRIKECDRLTLFAHSHESAVSLGLRVDTNDGESASTIPLPFAARRKTNEVPTTNLLRVTESTAYVLDSSPGVRQIEGSSLVVGTGLLGIVHWIEGKLISPTLGYVFNDAYNVPEHDAGRPLPHAPELGGLRRALATSEWACEVSIEAVRATPRRIANAQRVREHRGSVIPGSVWAELLSGKDVFWARIQTSSLEVIDAIQDLIPHITIEPDEDESPVDRRLAMMHGADVDPALRWFPWLYSESELVDLMTVLVRGAAKRAHE